MIVKQIIESHKTAGFKSGYIMIEMLFTMPELKIGKRFSVKTLKSQNLMLEF